MEEPHLYLINSFYQRPKWGKDANGRSIKLKNDFLQINIKNCDTNETKLVYFEEPQVDFYITKKKEGYDYPQMSLPETELKKMRCKYSDKEAVIAKAIGKGNEYFQACKTPSRWEIDRNGNSYKVDFKRKFIQEELYNSPFVYMGDMDIEDMYKNYFMEKHGRDVYHKYGKFKHGFLDIEVDQYYDEWDIEDYSGPINSITYFFKPTKTLYAFVLDNQNDSKDLQWVRNNREEFVEKYVKPEAHDDEINYKIEFYDTESELLRAFWKVIHETKPDFVGIWNMNFDIPYILHRMEILGMDLENTCCHPDVEEKYRVVRYKEDRDRNSDRLKGGSDENKHPSRLWDWVYISGYTQFYDMMALYSLIRKRFILPSYKLDDIAYEETGYRKLDYHEKGYTIRKLSHQNFMIFLAYSIIDTIRLYQIEGKTDDFHRSIIFADNTKLETSQKISYVIKNKMYRYYYDDENGRRIIGNNVTYNVKEKIDGAVIASPDNLKLPGMGILESKGYVYDDVVDFDEAAEYPRIILTFNISKNSIYGRIRKIEYNGREMDGVDEFNKLLQTRKTSLFELMHKYYGLPNVEDILSDIEGAYDKNAEARKKMRLIS